MRCRHGRQASPIAASAFSICRRRARSPWSRPTARCSSITARSTIIVELRDALEGQLDLPRHQRHRDHSRRLCALRRRLPRPLARHVRLRALGRPQQAPLRRARPLRHQAVLLRRDRRPSLLRLRGEGAPAVPARASRPTPTRSAEYLTFQYTHRRPHPVQGHQAAAAGPRACGRATARSRSGAIGTSTTRSIGTTRRPISTGACASCWTTPSPCICAATCRSAATCPAASTSSLIAILAARVEPPEPAVLPRQVHRVPRLRREPLRASWPRPSAEGELHQIDITAQDFQDNIDKVIYHLDYPCAGPGSFPQFMVSQLASQHVKVVLGGQGGDEIFGGYARYLVAYFEQCIKAAHRRHLPERQLRRHHRVDRSQSRRAARVQADDPAVLAARDLFGDHRRALFPPHRPLERYRRRGRLGRARQERVSTSASRPSSTTAPTSAKKPISTR